jgi:hypothetical protein
MEGVMFRPTLRLDGTYVLKCDFTLTFRHELEDLGPFDSREEAQEALDAWADAERRARRKRLSVPETAPPALRGTAAPELQTEDSDAS